MINKSLVWFITAVVVLVFAGGILLTGGHPDPAWLKFYSFAVSAVVVAIALWDRWLWRLKPVQRMKAVPRDLRGTWKGTLTSFWVDPNTGSSPPTRPAYLVIRQTWSSVSVILFTDESRSDSSLAKVSAGDGVSSLDYMYLGRPDNRIEHRSRMHHGSTSLDVTGNPATRLRGRYWTDRDSRGELELVVRVRGKFAEDFDSAAHLFA